MYVYRLVLQAGNDARERLKQVDATLASEETADSEMKEQFGDRYGSESKIKLI